MEKIACVFLKKRKETEVLNYIGLNFIWKSLKSANLKIKYDDVKSLITF